MPYVAAVDAEGGPDVGCLILWGGVASAAASTTQRGGHFSSRGRVSGSAPASNSSADVWNPCPQSCGYGDSPCSLGSPCSRTLTGSYTLPLLGVLGVCTTAAASLLRADHLTPMPSGCPAVSMNGEKCPKPPGSRGSGGPDGVRRLRPGHGCARASRSSVVVVPLMALARFRSALVARRTVASWCA